MSVKHNEPGGRLTRSAGQPELEAEALRRMLGDVEGYAAFQIDADGLVSGWSVGAERLLGHPEAEIVGRPHASLYPAGGVGGDQSAADLEAAARTGVLRANRYRVCADGTNVPVEMLLFAVSDERGVRHFVELSRDRLEEVRTQRLLAESEQRNRSLFHNNPDPVFVLDTAGRFLSVNAATESLSGYTHHELVGRHFTKLIPPGSRWSSLATRAFDRAIRGEAVQVELAIRRRTGQTADLAVTAVPVDMEGTVSGLFGIAKDLTERNRLAREQKALLGQLGTERARLAAVVRQMPAGVLIVDAPTGNVVLANDLADEILRRPVRSGESMEALLDGRVFGADGYPVPVQDLPLSRALRTGETVTGEELRHERGDGTQAWIRVHASPIRDSRGRIVAGVSIVDDIEEERRAADSLRFLAEASSVLTSSLDYRKMLRRIVRLAVSRFAELCVIDLSPQGGLPRRQEVAHADPDKQALVRSILKGPVDRDPQPDDLVGRVVRLGEPMLESEVEALNGSLAEGDVYRDVIQELGIVSLIVVPLQGRQRVLGAITFAVSDPDRAYSPNDLELALELGRRSTSAIENAELFEAAAAASEVKSNFLAIVSHELRTPLNAIVGYSELLLMGVPSPLPSGATHQVERIRQSADHLRRIVEEILTFTRIEGGTEQVRIEEVDLRATLEQAVEGVRALAAEKRLELRLDAPESPWILETDGPKVGRILGHLLSNAIKFTEIGGVAVDGRMENGALLLTVTDTGEGIEARHFEQIFEPFWQIDSSRTRRHEGTGLGLSVARQLTRLMGGDIRVRSTRGRGTEFVVSLPVDAEAELTEE